MYYIGIDLGTSAVKALLMDTEGHVLRTCTREYPLLLPRPGWSEQRPEDWESAVWACLRELAEFPGSAEIAGIGIAGQMHGLVVLDQNDAIIRPAILWNDGRSAKETAYLNDTVGREKLSAWTGNIAFAGFTAPKLLWMQANEPAQFAAIKKIMLPKDYIVYKLTGVHATDFSDASGLLLLDVENRRWSKDMLDICGVTQAQMPQLFESYEVVGSVRDTVAEETGLPRGIRVVAGAGDNAAAAIGTGTVGNGKCNISLGTSGTVFIARDRFGVDQNNALHSFAHADGSYHLMGCMLSAAACNKWWVKGILHTTNTYAKEESGVTDAMLGRNGTYWLPYLMGERSPHNDPNARGAFIGMRMDTGRHEMTQAVLEGVAYALRDSLEVAKSLGVAIHTSTLCGGGAKSPLWQKIMANVLHIRIELLATEEGPGLGSAILAAVGCGGYKSVAEAAQHIVQPVEAIEPQSEIAARYEERYRQFSTLYPALKTVFAGL